MGSGAGLTVQWQSQTIKHNNRMVLLAFVIIWGNLLKWCTKAHSCILSCSHFSEGIWEKYIKYHLKDLICFGSWNYKLQHCTFVWSSELLHKKDDPHWTVQLIYCDNNKRLLWSFSPSTHPDVSLQIYSVQSDLASYLLLLESERQRRKITAAKPWLSADF